MLLLYANAGIICVRTTSVLKFWVLKSLLLGQPKLLRFVAPWLKLFNSKRFLITKRRSSTKTTTAICFEDYNKSFLEAKLQTWMSDIKKKIWRKWQRNNSSQTKLNIYRNSNDSLTGLVERFSYFARSKVLWNNWPENHPTMVEMSTFVQLTHRLPTACCCRRWQLMYRTMCCTFVHRRMCAMKKHSIKFKTVVLLHGFDFTAKVSSYLNSIFDQEMH